jgi:hypothetical protein
LRLFLKGLVVTRMIKSLVSSVLVAALFLPSAYVLSETRQHDANSKGYTPAKGSHFYDLPLKSKEDEIADKVVKKLLESAKGSSSEVKPGSSAWIKQHLPEVRRTAADTPTTENIRALLLMEKMLKDKGRRLARRAAMVAQTDPYLDGSYKPTSNISMARERRSTADQGKDELVKKLVTEGVSLWIFVSGDCSTCERWISSLAALTEKYSLKVLWIVDPVTILPTPPKFTDSFWEYREAKGEAISLGVKSDVSMFAYHTEKKQYVLLSQGFVPVSSFSHKLIVSADFSGWVTPEEVENTIFRVNRNDLSSPDIENYTGDHTNPVEYSNYIYNQLIKGQ